VSDTVKAAFSVCTGFQNGCECAACISKRKTGVNGFFQDPFTALANTFGVEESSFSFANIIKSFYDPDVREELKNELVYYLVLIFILGGICFVFVISVILFISYVILKMKEGIQNKTARFVQIKVKSPEVTKETSKEVEVKM